MWLVVVLAVVLGMAPTAGARTSGPATSLPPFLVGGEHEYTVASGDSIWSITGRFTMSRGLFDRLNALPDPDRLQPGTRLRVSDRHIVPAHPPDGIVIDLAGRTLYWFAHRTLKGRFPVGIGRSDWATPPGHYRIVGRREDPVWHVPPSIQAEMRAHGEPVTAVVPAGPDNPLGKYWIQLSANGIGIHGTNAPASIGKVTSHGCLRLLPDDIARLYREAPDGTPVEIVYQPAKVTRDASGRVWLEVHRDVYGNRPETRADLHALIARAGLAGAVDWGRVDDSATRAWGVPEEVGPPVAPEGPALTAVPAEATVPVP
jgi:L,D-transpeptidase ErfK/SrfK